MIQVRGAADKKSICITGGASGMGLETDFSFSKLACWSTRQRSGLNEVANLFDPNSHGWWKWM